MERVPDILDRAAESFAREITEKKNAMMLKIIRQFMEQRLGREWSDDDVMIRAVQALGVVVRQLGGGNERIEIDGTPVVFCGPPIFIQRGSKVHCSINVQSLL